jgi:predicted nucleic acid-binding protein
MLMRRKVIFDSNILIALSKNKIDTEEFASAFGKAKKYISIVTKLEVLSKPELAVSELRSLQEFLAQCKVLPLGRKIAEETIKFRRKCGRKLPDSIIAATAVIHGLHLISNDGHLLKAAYPGLTVEPFALKAPAQ